MSNPDIDAHLARITAPGDGVCALPADIARSPALRSALRAAGWYAVVLDRAPVFSKDTLMHALYQSGEYPAYFGFNWDALADALSDFDWVGERAGIALIWRNPAPLRARAPEVYSTFLEIVAEAAAARAEAGAAPLRVVMAAEEEARL